MILVACWGGNVRSVYAGYILKHLWHYEDVVIVGVGVTSPALLKKLCDMSELVLAVGDEGVLEKIPVESLPKTKFLDIGYDRWGFKFNAELENLLFQQLHKAGLMSK